MRYYLDTNILVFYIYGLEQEMSERVYDIISDYSSILFTSSVCVNEFIYLFQRGKVGTDKTRCLLKASDIINAINETGIKIIPANEMHLSTCAKLPMYAVNHDPVDRLIVAQSISDRIPLISSDGKFHLYEKDGLDFIYNER